MKAEFAKRWAHALRHEYRQGTGRLASPREGWLSQWKEKPTGLPNKDEWNFCCLGVACDLVKDEVGGYWSEQGRFIVPTEKTTYMNSADMPLAVARHIGWTDGAVMSGKETAGSLPICDRDGRSLTLAELNDNGMTFDQIADIIDYLARSES